MQKYYHFCPYCSTQLVINNSEEERYAAKCPNCHNIIVVKNHGQSVSKPYVYKCPKCGKEHSYYEQINGMICDGCKSVMIASKKGTCLIDPELLKKGDEGILKYTKKVDKKVKLFNMWLIKPKKTKIQIIASITMAFVAIVFLWYILTPCSIEKTLAFADESALWKEFRDKNPINYQTIGIKSYEDNSYNIILSEPSPSVSLSSLNTFIKKYHGTVLTHKCPMGIDGWLQDVVLCFNGLKQSKIEKFRSDLFILLFGTDYKASFENFNEIVEHSNFLKDNINYQISAEELQKWFIEHNESFIDKTDGNDIFLDELLKNEKCGIYYSKNPGIVIWIINKFNNEIQDFDIPARIFALDTDLILGAIGRGNSIAIVGRERELPLHDLPPMRVETMKLLAATDKNELSQSYERNNIVAGKMSGGKDYAPILLSPELWHTEYGSMLNVTDQMLKSWSENGNIQYETFVYPKPYEWAFIESAMTDLGVTELTYNWNTSGAGWYFEADDENPYSVYAINRTGSLPVSYIPGNTDDVSEDDKVLLAEENAYDFFSGLASPELIKVVQYLSLYQIFTNFDYHLNYNLDTYSINTSKVESKVTSFLKAITKFGTNEKAIVRNSIKNRFIEYNKEIDSLASIPDRFRTKSQQDRYIDLLLIKLFSDPDEIANRTIKDFDSLKIAIDDYTGNRFDNKISHYLVNPRNIDYEILNKIFDGDPNDDITDDEAAQCYAYMLMDQVPIIHKYNYYMDILDLEEIRNDYINDNIYSHSNWIKCPTVVQSWNLKDSINQVGGHNLNSHITPIKFDKSLSKGQCIVEKLPDGRKIIKISPLDKGQITPSFMRKVERTGKIGKQYFAKTAQVPRTFDEVFPLKPRSERGFDPVTQVSRINRNSTGFSLNGKSFTCDNVDSFWNELSKSLNEEKSSAHEIVFENFSQDEVYMIIDGHPCGTLKKGETSRSLMSDFDFNHMKVSDVDSEGNVTVTIPKKSKNIIVNNGTEENVIPFREASIKLQFPSKSKNGWLKTIKQIFVNPETGDWSLYRLIHKAKSNGLNSKEAKELMHFQTAKNNHKFNNSNHDFVLQSQIA